MCCELERTYFKKKENSIGGSYVIWNILGFFFFFEKFEKLIKNGHQLLRAATISFPSPLRSVSLLFLLFFFFNLFSYFLFFDILGRNPIS